MHRRTRPSRLLYSCMAVAACLLIHAPASAQAEANFWIENEVVSSSETPVELQFEADGPFSLSIPSKSVTCSGGKFGGGRLLLNGRSHGTLVFESCNVACTLTTLITTHLIEHNKSVYEAIEGEGTNLVINSSGPKCSLSKTMKLKGFHVLEDSSGTLDKQAVTHLLKVASEALFAEGNEVKLSGSFNLKLSGAHTGRTWRGSFDEPTGDFRIKGENISSPTEVEWEFEKEVEISIPELEMGVNCVSLTTDSGMFLTGGKISATLLFENCTFLLGSEPFEPCTVKDFAAEVDGQLFLSSGKTIAALAPAEGPTFTIWDVSGEECPFAELPIELRGSVALRDSEEEFEAEAEQHQLEMASSLSLPCYALKWGENPVALEMNAQLRLAGEETGEPWSALAL